MVQQYPETCEVVVELKKQLFLYSCAWYVFLFVFWSLSGQPFGRPDLGDIGFHLQRSQDPLCFLQGCPYYAPLFHLAVAGLHQIFSLQASFVLVECFVLFFLLPWEFYRLSYTFWGEKETAENTVFLTLFGSSFAVITVVAGILPQALNIAFLALGMEAMIAELRSPSLGMKGRIALWGVLSVLSHQKGWYLYVFMVFVWLFLKEHYKTCIILLAAGTLIYPGFAAYPFDISHLPELTLLWLNPFNVYLAYQGRKKTEYREKLLLDAAIAASLLCAWIDPNYRPILTASILLSIYGGRALQEENHPERYLFAVLFMWAAHLLFCIAGVVAMIYLGKS